MRPEPPCVPPFSLCRTAETGLVRSLVSGVDGKTYAVDPDFRTVLACLRRLSDPNRDDLDKLLFLAKRFFLGSPPPDSGALFSFFVAGSDKVETDGPPLVDFEQDAGALYASFRQQYGIDLLRASLHWFEFRELLAGLNEYTPFGARVRLRALDESRVAPEDRAAVRRMKEKIALLPRISRTEQALLDELNRKLAAGEDPGGILEELRAIGP